ncbi:hypothetical protein MAP00_003719 [Monascus purpureus]|nr:hypothetical protein MAP00_003719 [Monascus purpureus]
MIQKTILSFYSMPAQSGQSAEIGSNAARSSHSPASPDDIHPAETDSQKNSQESGDILLSQVGSYMGSERQERGHQRSSERDNRRALLRETAKETKELLPSLLAKIPQAKPSGYLYSPPIPPKLNLKFHPGLPSIKVRVLDGDSFDTAVNLANCSQFMDIHDKKPVCVLNMANAYRAGGGWLSGALAQEEALCYRSSLSYTLKMRHYPLEDNQAIYSPNVVIFRESFQKGHRLWDLTKPYSLPIVSVISVAALDRPALDKNVSPPTYKNSADRKLMKDKMRLILRVAVCNKHRRLILGAFGCGAFANPNQEVANCWAEVLQEPEFSGWWENIVFAVMDDGTPGVNGESNLKTFQRVLHGLVV